MNDQQPALDHRDLHGRVEVTQQIHRISHEREKLPVQLVVFSDEVVDTGARWGAKSEIVQDRDAFTVIEILCFLQDVPYLFLNDTSSTTFVWKQ